MENIPCNTVDVRVEIVVKSYESLKDDHVEFKSEAVVPEEPVVPDAPVVSEEKIDKFFLSFYFAHADFSFRKKNTFLILHTVTCTN